MHYGDDTILHSENHKKLFFYKGKLIKEHGHRTRSISSIQFNSTANAPLNSNTTNCKKKRDQQHIKKRYIKLLYVNNNNKSDEHGKFLEQVLQLSGRKTSILTTIIELN
jgi:hypothetical protein